jgi:radial spoke head protein 9
LFRLQLELSLQQLLNTAGDTDFEDLLFWGKLTGLYADYYIALGLVYTGRYEFAEKRFYYATSTDFLFRPFPALNDQHREHYDGITGYLKGQPMVVHRHVEPVKAEGQEEEAAQKKVVKEVDPLASSEEEDPNALIVPVNLKEVDRVHYLVRAIENDCHVVPQGSFRLTTTHEV